nr:integrase, catalytic region, zinc finger, CCHC-type, peptidase aspartic, catalytic [Tanacetum cinerariifolium]
MHNNSQGKKQKVEDHRRNFKFSNNKTSVNACNDSLNAKTSNINFVCVICGKCVLNANHDLCVLHYINGVNFRTKQPIVVPISTREPKQNVNQSAATSHKKIVATKSVVKKPRSIIRKLYEQVSKTCSWWYPKFTPSRYKWKPKSPIGNVNTNLIEIILFIIDSGCSKHMTGNLKLLTNFVEKFLGTMKFGNDQITLILGYGDLVQGTINIKRVYYVEGLNHNLFSVGQFCDADLEVAFQKSTCYIRDLKGNDLLTSSCSTYLYSITPQDTSIPNPICLMAKATSSDPVPQCPTMALKHGILSPGPQSQENVPHAAETVTTSNELDLLFSLMFDELLNGTATVVSKTFAVNAADAPDKRQQQNITQSITTTVAADIPPLNIQTTHLIEIILFIIDSGCSKHKLLTNFVEKFLGTMKFGNDQITLILGYGDLVQGTINIKRVYYVKGLNHNLFSVGQFCDADLEVAFQKSTCYIRDLKGNDLLIGIQHQTSIAQTPKQNGVVKRRNRTLVEAARAMLSAAKFLCTFGLK